MNLKGLSYVGGSASPFIDEGDGFTGERERVQMLLSLVAHADEDWIMVGAQTLLMSLQNVRCMWEVVVSSSGRVDVGTYKILLRSLTTFTRYGESQRLQHY